jgi:hypothetical protein
MYVQDWVLIEVQVIDDLRLLCSSMFFVVRSTVTSESLLVLPSICLSDD